MAHRQWNPFLRLLPRVDADFGFRRKHRGFHGDRERVRRNIVREDHTGVWQLRTKSRVTVKTKSGLVRYIFVRYFSTVSIVTSGRRFRRSGPQPFMLPS